MQSLTNFLAPVEKELKKFSIRTIFPRFCLIWDVIIECAKFYSTQNMFYMLVYLVN